MLVQMLRDAQHDVRTVSEAGLRSVPDADVFAAAITDNRILLTHNPADFIELHEARVAQNLTHPGLFLVHRKNKPTDMTYDQIVKAIENLESTEVPFENTYYSLVQYNYP